MSTSIKPLPGPARDYQFPKFERRTLQNGMTVLVAPSSSLPIITVLAVVDAGAVAETSGKEGVAGLTAYALNEGVPKYDGESLTDHLEQLGTSIGGVAGWDSAMVSMTLLSDNIDTAFARFAEVLTVPTFPEAAIERLKGERIAELMQIETEPRELADEKFDEYIYDAASRFRRPAGGTAESVRSITRDDVVAFHRSRYQPSATTLVIVGDITTATAEAMAINAFGNWTGDVVPTVRANDKPARSSRAMQLVRKGDAPQSEIRIGHVGVSRTHPDYFPITIMNAVLGGLFSSRINLNLREVHGYTYGASSAFDWRREAGPFVIGTAVASDVTAPAIQETLKEIDRLRAEPISDSELTLATSYLEGVFPIRYETTAAIAGALAGLIVYGLPEDWYDTYRTRMSAVTIDDVQRAARTYLRPDELQIVIVGDAEVIRAPLEALGFGPLEVVNP